MRSTHNTIRALAIGIGLTLLVVTGTAAMMAAFSGPSPAKDIYRRAAVAPLVESATHMATGHDTVLYERVVLADGRTQWVLTEESDTSLATMAKSANSAPEATLANNNNNNNNNSIPTIYSGSVRAVSYTLVIKPSGLSKPVKSCSRSAYDAYDIACNTLS
ncbi:MAG: hypothetical protein EON92_10070 [Burkholderiales bacterium]|nr:MAG: hypothetical protein EON92_10070 [Burkholderiales bacterium]